MRTFTNGQMHVFASYDALVYLQERLFLQIRYEDPTTHCYFVISNQDRSIEAVYHTKRAGDVAFADVSDFIRYAAASGSSANLYIRACEEGDAETLASITVNVTATHAGIDPKNVQRPRIEKPAFAEIFHSIAPAVLLADFGYAPRVVFEYSDQSLQPEIEATSTGGTRVTLPLASGSNTLPAGTAFFRVIDQGEQDLEQSVFTFKPLVDCDLYACVEWVGVSGELKRATWRAGKRTVSAEERKALEHDARPFRTIKGREESAVIWLDGLTPYDYDYYSDIITSSDVRVVFRGNEITLENGRLPKYLAVDVMTSAATPNDGTCEHQKLEVQIKYRKYDAVGY